MISHPRARHHRPRAGGQPQDSRVAADPSGERAAAERRTAFPQNTEGDSYMFQLDLKSRKSIYEQVVDNLKELIISHVLTAEEKLPSVRDLSRTLTVNPNTVQKAYRELERQGYVYSVTGLGTFVAQKEDTGIDERRLSDICTRIRTELKELFYLGLSFEEVGRLLEELLEERREWN